MSQLATRVSLIAIIAGLCLAGCGQKGNLYLPNQKKKVPTTTSQPDTPTPPAAPPAAPPAVQTQPDTPSAPATH